MNSSHYLVDINIVMFLFFDLLPFAAALGTAIGRRWKPLSILNLIFMLIVVGVNLASGYLPQSVIYSHLSAIMWVNTVCMIAGYIYPVHVVWKTWKMSEKDRLGFQESF